MYYFSVYNFIKIIIIIFTTYRYNLNIFISYFFIYIVVTFYIVE